MYGHTDGILCLTMLPNGYLASGSNDNTVRVYSDHGTLVHKYTSHSGYVLCITALKNGDVVSGSYDQTIKVS